MCADENVPNNVLVAIFERDPVLTEALLARANGAYYNLSGRPCVSLSEALVRQGRRSAHSVILQQTLAGMVCRPGGIWTDMASKVWAHMVRTGPIARNIARAFDVDPEQAMTLGLLHDVGKLVVFDRVSALRTATRREPELRKGAVSRLLRVLHEPLGGICALHWNLGDDSALAIATHHRDSLPATPDSLSEVIWLAERWDLAAWRLAPVKLGDLWAEGRLTGRVSDVVNTLKSLGRDAEPSLSR
jgi:HD-like signal output (HDOD) protein